VSAATARTFVAATTRIPLGSTVAVELLGPIGVAAVRGRGGRSVAWVSLALVGVGLLTRPWVGSGVDLLGLALAGCATLGWAAYIVLIAQVGSRVAGLGGLAVPMVVAALAVAPLGWPEVTGRAGPVDVLACAGLALLLPLLPFTAELLALRRLPQQVFGVWMSLEPVIGTLVGLAVLGQVPRIGQLAGMLLVVGASVGAALSAR
jgi:inner membrane transporter RhtA